ncbi:hypothetical protein IB274_03305 [Pseudomonas sp. PDM18]|uniref:hypothetical protein n=1 Tax=Pseudomonas sp. PDM18 TaxID=2769253 RepID=UPI001781290B|nr:hypothetical protein [Pseudomonas sp. PDM18]MBD9675708.1 hypothetical protein [Pseudomonas sp. PDM18]
MRVLLESAESLCEIPILKVLRQIIEGVAWNGTKSPDRTLSIYPVVATGLTSISRSFFRFHFPEIHLVGQSNKAASLLARAFPTSGVLVTGKPVSGHFSYGQACVWCWSLFLKADNLGPLFAPRAGESDINTTKNRERGKDELLLRSGLP